MDIGEIMLFHSKEKNSEKSTSVVFKLLSCLLFTSREFCITV